MSIKINILNSQMQIPQEIVEAAEGDSLIARIFFNRGYAKPEIIRQMMDDKLYTPTQPLEFPEMAIAVKRIAEAVKSNEGIAVYGDYDVDGVTGTAVLVQCLNILQGNVMYHVPDRFTEGYGMNSLVVKGLKEKGVSLLITCDCGISNHTEIALAKSLGMDVIITDHHNIPDSLPNADAVLNPKLLEEGHKAQNISGCAMAYFLCLALLEHFELGHKGDEFLDLVAMSLVADVVSLNGENRYLLKKAIPKLFKTQRTGLRELFAVIGEKASLNTVEDIAFQIAPRINAAGRMESAALPVELLLTDNSDAGRSIAQEIEHLNTQRKRLQQEIIEQAEEMVEQEKKNRTILVLFNEFWHHGVIGIAAGKLAETYNRPVILLSMKDDGHTVTGSARSVKEVDIYELIKECSGRLGKFGGHSQAAGLSLEKDNLEDFTREIEITAEKKYFFKDSISVDVDWELDAEQINEELYNRLMKAGPYGEGFEQPIFVTRNLSIISDRKTAKNHHILVLAGQKGIRIPAVQWFGGDENLQGRVFDIIYSIGRNTYMGNDHLQLTILYMLETDKTPRCVFNGKLIDGRGIYIEQILKNYQDVTVFYEGFHSRCPADSTVNRYNIRKSENLVFSSIPVNSNVFREVVSLANPDNIILNFSILPDYSFKGFLANFMGFIKHVINNMDGCCYLEEAAVRLCVEESIVKASMNYLKALGKLEYYINPDDDMVYFNTSNRKPDRVLYLKEKNLRNALMEKAAYRDFLVKLETEKFMEYLK